MPTTPLLLLLLAIATYASSVWNGKTDTAWHSERDAVKILSGVKK